MIIALTPIAVVGQGRQTPEDDNWGEEEAVIVLDPERFSPESLQGIEDFSHIEVVSWMHQVEQEKIEYKSRHPRGNSGWPKVGIFAQRGRERPNQIGTSICQILGTKDLMIHVKGLDLIHGTPILDIKPVISGFLPQGKVKEPTWAKEIMKRYWANA